MSPHTTTDTMTLLVFIHETLSLVRKIRTDRIVDSDIYCLEFLASTKIRTDRIVDSDTEQELTESLIRVNKDKADRTVDSELCTVGVLSLLCSTNQKKTQKLKVFSSPGDLKIY